MIIKGTITTIAEVNVDSRSIWEALEQRLQFQNVVEKDNALYIAEDISCHGSPCYKKTLFSKNPELVKIYKAMQALKGYCMDPENKKYHH